MLERDEMSKYETLKKLLLFLQYVIEGLWNCRKT